MLSILLPNHNEENIHAFIEEVEKEFPEAEIIIACDRYGKGKGWAVRTALEQAKGEWIAILDSDGDIPARMLRRLLPFCEDFDIVVGTKKRTVSSYQRKIVTFLSRCYIRVLFGLNVDTQTGIKIFRRTAIDSWVTDGFLFDIELLATAKTKGHNMVEVPIECEIKRQMPLRTLWKTFLESLSLWYRLSFRAGK